MEIWLGFARTYNRNSKPLFGFCRYQCMVTLLKLSTKTLQDIWAVSSFALVIDISGCTNFPRPTASTREKYPRVTCRGRSPNVDWLRALLHRDLTVVTHMSRGIRKWLLSGVDSHLPGCLPREAVKEAGVVSQGSSWSAVVVSSSGLPGQHKLLRSVRKLQVFSSGWGSVSECSLLILPAVHSSLPRSCSELWRHTSYALSMSKLPWFAVCSGLSKQTTDLNYLTMTNWSLKWLADFKLANRVSTAYFVWFFESIGYH